MKRRYLSTLEVAAVLDCAPDTVRVWARKGKLRSAIETRAGRLFDERDVQRLAAERKDGQAA